MKLLVENECSLESLLQYSISFARRDIFNYLLEKNIDINELNHAHQTPIHQAIISRKRYYMYQLLEKGADISIPDI